MLSTPKLMTLPLVVVFLEQAAFAETDLLWNPDTQSVELLQDTLEGSKSCAWLFNCDIDYPDHPAEVGCCIPFFKCMMMKPGINFCAPPNWSHDKLDKNEEALAAKWMSFAYYAPQFENALEHPGWQEIQKLAPQVEAVWNEDKEDMELLDVELGDDSCTLLMDCNDDKPCCLPFTTCTSVDNIFGKEKANVCLPPMPTPAPKSETQELGSEEVPLSWNKETQSMELQGEHAKAMAAKWAELAGAKDVEPVWNEETQSMELAPVQPALNWNEETQSLEFTADEAESLAAEWDRLGDAENVEPVWNEETQSMELAPVEPAPGMKWNEEAQSLEFTAEEAEALAAEWDRLGDAESVDLVWNEETQSMELVPVKTVHESEKSALKRFATA